MLSGTIQNVEPPDSSDQRGNQYQFITITDQNTGQPTRGRIGAKNPYSQQDIGAQIQVDVQQRQNEQGPYLYFKKHYDKPYGSQQSSYQSRQAPQQSRRATNGDDMVRIRSMALAYAKDLVVADKIPHANLEAVAVEFTAFIQTGKWSFSQAKWPEPSGVDGPQDIDGPPVADSDVPNF